MSAASQTVTSCANLQAALNQVATGDVITLDVGSLCNAQYTLPDFNAPSPDHVVWTLRGLGPGEGFDGTGLPGRPVFGLDVHRLEIQNLTFRDGTQTGRGGALYIGGESGVAIRNSIFENNEASGNGGAVAIEPFAGTGLSVNLSGNRFGSTDPAQGNVSGGDGGAVAVEMPGQSQNSGINTSEFRNNVAGTDGTGNGGGYSFVVTAVGTENTTFDSLTVVGNSAAGSGGGGYVVAGGIVDFTGSSYGGNVLEEQAAPPPAGEHLGGGLYVDSSAGVPEQSGNTFRGNEIETIPNSTGYSGGGQFILGGGTTESEVDFYDNNTLPAPPGGGESEGAGLSFRTDDEPATFHGLNLRAARNTITGQGEGAGIYVGDPTPCAPNCAARLELVNATVAGNSVALGGQFAGIAAGGAASPDELQLQNSIVFGNTGGGPDIGAFTAPNTDVDFSDACTGGVPYPGTGNICANPLLVDPAGTGDVHQTAQSPTIDKGSNAIFEAEGEACCDFEGDERPRESDLVRRVDMGADERPPAVVQPPPTGGGGGTQAAAQCADGRDNDGDGAVDRQDPGCLLNGAYSAADANEGDEDIRDLVLCGRRQISLVRADQRGRRVVLNGLVAPGLAGRRVTILANYGGKGRKRGFRTLTTVRPSAAGAFTARVARPSRKFFNKARFRARVGKARSVALKLPQSLASTSVRASGGQITLRGKVRRAVLGKRNAVTVRRLVCGRYQTVGRAKPDRRGNYTVRFKAPSLATAALYRAETRVLARPGSKRYVRQFARAIGITLSGQTG